MTPNEKAKDFRTAAKKGWATRRRNGTVPPKEYFIEIGRKGGQSKTTILT